MSTTRTSRPPRASVTVENLDRAPAAQAAVALRRAGLRPALERTFHWGEDTHGLVVAQEPPAGSEVALDSTVLLFISAPGERRESHEQTDGSPAVGANPEADGSQAPAGARRKRRRRKAPHTAQTSLPDTQQPVMPPSTPAWEPEPRHDTEATYAPESDSTAKLPAEPERFDRASPESELDRLLSLAEAQLRSRAENRWPADGPCSVGTSRVVLFAAAGVLVAVLLFLAGVETHALQAAGAFNGTPISGVQTFVDKLRGNLVWLGGTAMGLVIAVVGIMFMAGHSRAHDLAIRTIVGLAILASISGIVA